MGPRQRPRLAALSGSQLKAPGSAGGYLLSAMKSGRSTVPTTVKKSTKALSGPNNYKEMLKMKVDPTMCMKTLANGDKTSVLQTVFWLIVHGFCRIWREFCPFLREHQRFPLERFGNSSPGRAVGRGPARPLTMTVRGLGPATRPLRATHCATSSAGRIKRQYV